ncbi:MAG TPA: FAD-dependent oxidoreductase [Bryobacteraceae bacterium]|nr:FAD-dependent oxidoreductase [Bryobacteraceae bacterium]
MNAAEEYDVLVLGGGTSGKLVAWTMAKEGRRTAVVDRKYIGGSCPNIACLPSKNVIHSAKVASLVKRHREFGIETGPISIDMAGVYARKREMVEGIIQVHLDKYHQALDPRRGDELIFGNATFVAPRTVHVALRDGGERTLTAGRVFVNVGTHAAIPDAPGLREAKPMTHIEALDLQRCPDHLIVLGGGYVGLELSQALRRLGSRVTLIERSSQVASNEDADVSQAILQLFQDEGIGVLLGTQVLRVNGLSGDRVSLQLQTAGSTRNSTTQTLEGTDILVATGRTPNTAGLGLEKAGIEITEKGHIRVNDRLETTAPNVWAMGECAGSPYFTHVSEDDFNIIHENLNGGHRSTRDRLVPYCVFIDPELARVGLNESQARERKIAYGVASVPVAAAAWRPWTLSEKRGFMKTLIAADSDRILGFTAFGPEAGELMGTVQLAMLAGVPYTLLRDTMFAHPTMTEGLKTLFMAVPQPPEKAEQVQPARTYAD